MKRALLIIDYQNDFAAPTGALSVAGGEEIAELLNEEAAGEYDMVVATRDWHPADHSSFEQRGGPWPVHCVQGTEGAELHPALDRERIDLVLDKGEEPAKPGYSAFELGDLAERLRGHGIEAVTVVGIATDVCVRASALDALEAGFEVEVLREGVRGVEPEESERALEEVAERGGTVR